MSDCLELRTLGGLSILLAGQPLSGLASRKAEALLVYLACAARPLPREVLADLLWDDRTQQQAQANLRVLLSSLHKQLGEYVEITRETVAVNAQAGVWLDAAALEEKLAAVAGEGVDTPEKAGQVNEALTLYQGDFLQGFTIREARNFEAWSRPERERLHRLVAGALYDLVAFELATGLYQSGLEHVHHLLALDPLHEAGHRQLMTLLALSNRRTEALAQYEQCRQRLDHELGVLPSVKTQELHTLLLRGEPPPVPEIGQLRRLRPPRAVEHSPYRGLASFRERDAPFFYGRENFVEKLYRAAQTTPRGTIVVGASGSGKSSTLHAGLLPLLREAGDWALTGLRPGPHPFHALAGALLRLLEPDLGEIERLAKIQHLSRLLQTDGGALERVLDRLLQKQAGGSRLLIWIDQFEELYTLCQDPAEQRAFVDTLLGNRTSGVFLLTMRADFMGHALSYRPFADLLQDASLLLGPMTREELRAAIEQPAEKQGAAFEEGLVERILDDVGDEPGNLPLLEFALTLLWEEHEQGWLTHAGYERIGRVEGALACHAEQIYSGLSPGDRERTRRALIQLVRPGEGTDDTRRVATREELGEESWELIRYLAGRRLVVTDRDARGEETAEVVHEALIQRWDRFQEWMESDREFRAWQERLRTNLRQWQGSGEDEGALLGGTPLSIARQWLGERESDLSAAEAEFILKSQIRQERREAERDRRRRRTIIGLVAGLLITVALAAFAYYQRADALAQRQNSRRQAAILLAGQAESELAAGFYDRAVLLALAALQQFPYTAQAEHALGQAVLYNRALQQYTGHSSAVTAVAWSPDGTRAASASSTDNTVHIWDPATGKTLLAVNLPAGISGNILDMALNVTWTPDGKRLLVLAGDRYRLGSQDFDLLLLDTTTGELLSSVEIPNKAEPASGEITASFLLYPTGSAAAIAPESGRLATLGGDNTALIWDAAWQAPDLVLRGHQDAVNSVNWSPDGKELVTAGMDGTARVWNAGNGAERLLLEGHEGRVAVARWSPAGSLLATAGEDGTIRLWDTGSGRQVRQLEPDTASVWSLAWSPDGRRLVSGHDDGRLAIWDVTTGDRLLRLAGHQGLVSDLAWSPVDDRLLSSDNSGFARVWNGSPTTAWRTFPVSYAQGLDWSGDGRFLAVAGGDTLGGVEPPSFAIWDVAADRVMVDDLAAELGYYGAFVFFSSDDRRILYAGDRGFPDFAGGETVYVLDPWSGEFLRSFTVDKEKSIRSVNWSPDGSQVATGTFWSNEIWIWDYDSGKLSQKLSHAGDDLIVQYVAWSPDGSKFAAAISTPGVVPVWDARSWDLLYTIDGHEPPAEVWSVDWSPDGSKLLTTAGSEEAGAKDTTARIWDGETGEELLVLRGHTKSVIFGYWSPDGQRIVTASIDNTVRIWDANTGSELLRLSPPPAIFGLQVAWSPDGRYLATAGLGSQVSVWRAWSSRQELLDYARQCCLFRKLTAQEQERFGLADQ